MNSLLLHDILAKGGWESTYIKRGVTMDKKKSTCCVLSILQRKKNGFESKTSIKAVFLTDRKHEIKQKRRNHNVYIKLQNRA